MKSGSIFLAVFFSFIFLNTNAQKSIQCGLLTSFSLVSGSANVKPSESDISVLKNINSGFNVQTYMSKTVTEPKKRILISLYTTGTYQDLSNKINDSKMSFNNKKTITKDGVSYTCYNFIQSNKNVARIIFNEPKLTLCLVFDVLTMEPISDYDAFNNDIIKRISFRNTGN